MRCENGVLGAAEDCEDGMVCVTVAESGEDRCVQPMGDDDDSGTGD